MTDRNVQFPNRYQLTKVEGTDDIYDLTPAPGTITAEGTMINKASLLTDETEEILFGNADDRTVDDAFNMISRKLSLIMQNVAELTLTVQDSEGHGIPGVLITNLFDDAGNPVYTNSGGAASGYIPEGNTTISITGYADIENYSETIAVVKGEAYTKTWTVTTRDFLKITSTQNVKFSGNVTKIDIDVLGGGGGGTSGTRYTGNYTARSGAGGAAGDLNEALDVQITPNTDYSVVVGSGGIGGNRTNGGKGGTSSFGNIVSAEGGDGATYNGLPGSGNNGNGGASVTGTSGSGASPRQGNPGGAGLKQIFSSFTEKELSGGGGASGGVCAAGGTGGSPGGGTGSWGGNTSGNDNTNLSPGGNGVDGKGGGGGGAGAKAGVEDGTNFFNTNSGGQGGSGCVAIRMHLASAA